MANCSCGSMGLLKGHDFRAKGPKSFEEEVHKPRCSLLVLLTLHAEPWRFRGDKSPEKHMGLK